jgi:crotonobetaine/carnitine-CoA ligase
VFESAAVGVPDEMRDEAIRVFVVLAQGATVSADELLAHCQEHLARFKVPDAVEFVDELPRTAVGKVQKHLLRRRGPMALGDRDRGGDRSLVGLPGE